MYRYTSCVFCKSLSNECMHDYTCLYLQQLGCAWIFVWIQIVGWFAVAVTMIRYSSSRLSQSRKMFPSHRIFHQSVWLRKSLNWCFISPRVYLKRPTVRSKCIYSMYIIFKSYQTPLKILYWIRYPDQYNVNYENTFPRLTAHNTIGLQTECYLALWRRSYITYGYCAHSYVRNASILISWVGIRYDSWNACVENVWKLHVSLSWFNKSVFHSIPKHPLISMLFGRQFSLRKLYEQLINKIRNKNDSF